MILKKIDLFNFRNFKKAAFLLNPFLTLIFGENAKGKTSLLESIYFLISGVGFREDKEEELIFLGKKNCWVEGSLIEADKNYQFKILLEKRSEGVEKKFYFEKVKKNYFQYRNNLPRVVLFSPEQIRVINDAPGWRRLYFDKFISQYDIDYKTHLNNYENALRRRNKVLEKEKDEDKIKEELQFWNDYLEREARYITDKRKEYICFLNNHFKLENKKFIIKYLKNEFTQERLKDFYKEELRLKKTLIGPQRDDFQIYLVGEFEKNIHIYGSRSEQRLALFWLKVNEINYCVEIIKKRPVILLDDVFSELDFHHKKLILDLVKKYQTIATTTEIEICEMIEVPKTIIKL